MARIRTIKPEFPQSESMGRVSRDARLLFIQLWTLCDDEGRTRAASRMLASLLFPYDDGEDGHVRTSAKDIDRWLDELEREGCIIRYQVEDSAYLQICKWLNHQKIDHASKSKIPPPDENSRALAKHREPSWLDQGPRTKDQGEDQGPGGAPAPGDENGFSLTGQEPKEPKPKKAKAAKTGFDPLAIDIPPQIPEWAWEDWVAYRKDRRLPAMTEQTCKAQIGNLIDWASKGMPPEDVIRQSIANGWQGLFELKRPAVGARPVAMNAIGVDDCVPEGFDGN